MNGEPQKGTTTVEFAIVGAVTLTLIFTVDRVRPHPVHPERAGRERAPRDARRGRLRRRRRGHHATAATFVSLPELSDSNVVTEYLDDNGAPLGDPSGADYAVDRVRACPDRGLQLPGCASVHRDAFHGAGDLVDHAPRKPRRPEISARHRPADGNTRSHGPETQGPARQPLRGGASHVEREPRRRARTSPSLTRLISNGHTDPLHGVHPAPDVLVLRFDAESLAELATLAQSSPDTRPPLIVVGPAGSAEAMRLAVRSGARDFLAEPLNVG